MKREFRWLPYGERRHAIRQDRVPRDDAETLCGLPLVVPITPPYPEWCWPTCQDCDRVWREREGIPPYPRQKPSPAQSRHAVPRTTKPVGNP
ncbi:zinc finger protein [Actinosynnema sp. NPDC020468]|uniref:zinc finger protein n=1 Tax=Actinosynnema sp. NPDC020468 TaxID=3154488 RepID=UPI0033EE34E7